MIKREKTDTIVIHCSATPPTMDIGVETIREWHVGENHWDDVGYHYIIKRTNGELETGRDESMVGSHARAVNGTSLGICLVGGSNSNGDWENNFTDEQFVSLKSLILDLIKRYEMPEDFKQIKKIIGHYQVDDKKECPSFKVPEWLENNGLKDYVV
jgi:N-acetylmuramoyl-L-alanine amidase